MIIKNPIQTKDLLQWDNTLYATRCIIGVVICYILFIYFPSLPFQWSVVSVVVAISPDNSPQLAVDRMKANLLGCAIGFALFFVHEPNLLMLCIGIILVIISGLSLQLQGSIRSALAAIVVLMVDSTHEHDWRLALGRLSCVIIGCLIALLVTIGFNRIFTLIRKKPNNQKEQ